VLEKIVKCLERDLPHIEVCGAYSPPFKEDRQEDDEDIICRVNEARLDVLWIGMTAPKQEKWFYNNCPRLDEVPLIGATGVVFDF